MLASVNLAGPVLLVDPFGRGGGPDVIGRTLVDQLSEAWGVPVSVENRPGDGATVAPAFVAASRPDGRTLLISTSAHAYSAALRHDLSYDPIEDFIAVAPLTTQPYVLVVAASSGWGTLDDLVATARDRPGTLRFASMGVGTGTHLGLEQLNAHLDLSARHVPAGPTDSITETIERVVSRRADYALAPLTMATAPLAAGELVALGVSTHRRCEILPTIPSLAEAGADNFDFPIWYGIWAPTGTPAALVDRLRKGIADVLATARARDQLAKHCAQPITLPAVEFGDFVRREVSRACAIAVAAGIAGQP